MLTFVSAQHQKQFGIKQQSHVNVLMDYMANNVWHVLPQESGKIVQILACALLLKQFGIVKLYNVNVQLAFSAVNVKHAPHQEHGILT